MSPADVPFRRPLTHPVSFSGSSVRVGIKPLRFHVADTRNSVSDAGFRIGVRHSIKRSTENSMS